MVTDGGPTALRGRAAAPDFARGLMLALVAVANVHLFLGGPVGVRGYPVPTTDTDRVVTLVQLLLVDGRAYPLFAALLGYGLVRVAARASGSVLARRGVALLVLGLLHGVLLFSGDILGAYGIVTLALAGVVAAGQGERSDGGGAGQGERSDGGGAGAATILLAGAATVFGVLVSAPSALAGGPSYQPSAGVADALTALGMRAAEWPSVTVISTILVLPGVLVGVWAGQAGVLDDPARHRRLLVVWAVVGLPVGALLGLPLALAAAGWWTPSVYTSAGQLAGIAHSAGGYLGALGWLGLLGLLASVRLPGRAWIAAAGTWSLTLYVTQSVVFDALLPAWSGGRGTVLTVSSASLLALGVWVVSALVAAVLTSRGLRGPLELLVRWWAYRRERDRGP